MTTTVRRVVALPGVMCIHCCRRGYLTIWRGAVVCRLCQLAPAQIEQLRADVTADNDPDRFIADDTLASRTADAAGLEP